MPQIVYFKSSLQRGLPKMRLIIIPILENGQHSKKEKPVLYTSGISACLAISSVYVVHKSLNRNSGLSCN